MAASTMIATVSSVVKDRRPSPGKRPSELDDDGRACVFADDLRPIRPLFYRAPPSGRTSAGAMSMIGRQDRVLLGGLAIALIVVAAKPIRFLLDLARDVERSSGLALIPALLILTVVFLFHQQGKRQEARTRAATAEADARQAGTRAAEMERLVAFGQALGRSLDADAIG